MAKNLKLTIKNNQLAEVLKSNKLKKTQLDNKDSKEAKPELEVPPTAPPVTDGTSEKRVVKAKKMPSNFLPPKPAEPVAEVAPPVVEQEPEPIALEVPVEAPIEAKEPEVATQERPLDVKEIVPVVKKEEEKREEESAADRKAKEKKKGKKPDAPPQKEETPVVDPKAKKNIQSHRRQAFTRVFDSREQGDLRSEEENWRRRKSHRHSTPRQEIAVQRPKEITIRLPISVKDLAAAMKLKAGEIIQKFFLQGLMLTINDSIEDPIAIELIGYDYDCKITVDTAHTERLNITEKNIDNEIAETNPALLVTRPPVVTVMGHVDHGKTSIIDAFRQSNITAGEAGAITQHIGAFQCKTKHGSFTVLDTPGHEAFSAIRARGANVTDIVVLVVAGDEGIKMQTEEAIEKAKEADVPIIVAINKMDKPGFNPDEIYRQLADRNLLPEAWGGTVITINCSAKTKEGIDHLAEMIAIQSDVLELKANPTARARGTVLESELHRGLGPTATLLVQNGTLKIGDAVIFGHEYGRIKTMQDEYGHRIHTAPPSAPVKVTGLSGVPVAGNEFISLDSEKEARKIAEDRKSSVTSHNLRQSSSKNIENLMKQQVALKEKKVLNLIIKADVGGSLEAIKSTLLKLPDDKVELRFISTGVGQISESDIERAEATKSLIIGFHTNVESHAESMIKQSKVTIVLHDVIYHLVDDVKLRMTAILDKVRQETEVGEAKVLATFKSSQLGIIAGCQVIDGLIKRSHFAKVFREGEVVWQGPISSLKRHKEDVKEVKKDVECGIFLNGFDTIKEGDIIKTYEVAYIAQEL